jgi:hypothetical protein
MKKIKNFAYWIYKRLKTVKLIHWNTSSTDLAPKIIYNSLDMPFTVFENALVDKDYSQIEDFEKVFTEYCESIGGKEMVLQLRNLKEITLLSSRITLAQQIIAVLEAMPTDEMFELLKDLNYHDMVPAPALNDIDQYIVQVVPWINREGLDLAKLIRDTKIPEDAEEFEYTRDYFTDAFIEISSAFNIHLSKSSITLREYCRWAVKYKRYLQKLETENTAK